MQANLTAIQKYATMHTMSTDYHDYEYKKAQLRERITFHKQNIILQSILSILLVTGGIYAGQKKSILVPLILAPSAATSVSKLEQHTNHYRNNKRQLKNLERN